MQLINESKRNIIFEIPPVIQGELNKASGVQLAECDHIRFKDYVTVKQNQLLFPKTVPGKDDTAWIFNSVDDCEKWIKDYEAEVRMTDKGFVPMARMDKSFYGVKSTALKINPSDWEKMQSYFSGGDEFKESDFAIFESWLANNFLDRDRERFPLDVLKSFNKSIVGKSKITAHQWGPPGNGRFFKSRIEELTVDQTLEMIGGAVSDKNFKKHLMRVKELDGGIFWLVPTYYMLNISENDKQAVREVRSGIVKDMSIGFGAPRKIYLAENMEEYEIESSAFGDSPPPDGVKILWKEFRNTKELEAEAYEGSHVFLGSQHGAATYKNAGNGVQVTTPDMEKVFEEWFQKKFDKVYAGGITKEQAKEHEFIELKKPKIVLSEEFVNKFDSKEFIEYMKSNKKSSDSLETNDNENLNTDKKPEIDIEKYLQSYLLKKDCTINWITEKDLTDSVQDYFSKHIDGWIHIDTIEDENIKALCNELDMLICKECLNDSKYLGDYSENDSVKVPWTTVYVNSLEDNCFAYTEETGKKDNDGRTVPKTARHLPHHEKGNGASGTGGVVDLPHLRNALARVSQVRPVTDKIDKANLVEMAKDHLVAHAKNLGVGDYGEENVRNVNIDDGVVDKHQGVKMELNFKIEDIGVDVPIDAEKLEDGLKQASEAVTKVFTEKTTMLVDSEKKLKETGDMLEEEKAAKQEATEKLASLTKEHENLEQELKAVKEVYGDEYSLDNVKRSKNDANAYRKFLIDGIIKFKKALNIILADEVENEIKFIANDPIERLKQEHDRYEKLFDDKYGKNTGDGLLPNNTDDNRNVVTEKENQPQETAFHEARRRQAAQIM